MATPEDLEARLSAVEREVARLRDEVAGSATDSSAARVLAAGADRDVSEVRAELRAHTSALNALRESQLHLERTVDAGFAQVDARFAQVDTRFAQVDTRFAQVDARFDQVQAGFSQVDANFAQVETRFAQVGAGLAEIVELVRGLERP